MQEKTEKSLASDNCFPRNLSQSRSFPPVNPASGAHQVSLTPKLLLIYAWGGYSFWLPNHTPCSTIYTLTDAHLEFRLFAFLPSQVAGCPSGHSPSSWSSFPSLFEDVGEMVIQIRHAVLSRHRLAIPGGARHWALGLPEDKFCWFCSSPSWLLLRLTIRMNFH